MRTIGEAATQTDLPVKTVRYYAEIGLIAPSARAANGYRLYDENEIAQLVFVRRARTLGFSIEDCRELLALYSDQDRASADVKRLAQQHLKVLSDKVRELLALRDELQNLVEACDGDSRPSCPILSTLAGTKS
ncbi:MAG: Cu(I)-responsive transcriptional regulator [Pseudomonadota bacterium]